MASVSPGYTRESQEQGEEKEEPLARRDLGDPLVLESEEYRASLVLARVGKERDWSCYSWSYGVT